jgi:hypothetical protein
MQHARQSFERLLVVGSRQPWVVDLSQLVLEELVGVVVGLQLSVVAVLGLLLGLRVLVQHLRVLVVWIALLLLSVRVLLQSSSGLLHVRDLRERLA